MAWFPLPLPDEEMPGDLPLADLPEPTPDYSFATEGLPPAPGVETNPILDLFAPAAAVGGAVERAPAAAVDAFQQLMAMGKQPPTEGPVEPPAVFPLPFPGGGQVPLPPEAKEALQPQAERDVTPPLPAELATSPEEEQERAAGRPAAELMVQAHTDVPGITPPPEVSYYRYREAAEEKASAEKAKQEREAQLAAQYAETQARLAEEATRYATNIAEQDAAEAKALADATVDPRRLFHNMSIAEKVLSLISVAIGGYLSPLNGGRNAALDLLMKLVQQDTEAQAQNIENRRAAMGMKRASNAEKIRQRSQLNQLKLQALKNYHDARVAGMQSPITEAENQMRQSQFDVQAWNAMDQTKRVVAQEQWQRGMDAAKIQQAQAELTEQKRHAQIMEAEGWYGLKTNRMNVEGQLELDRKKLALAADEADAKGDTAKASDIRKRGILIGGEVRLIGLGGDNEMEALRGKEAAAQTIAYHANALITLYDKNGGNLKDLDPGDPARREALAHTSAIKMAIAKAGGGMGRMTDKDMEIVEARIIGKPGALFSWKGLWQDRNEKDVFQWFLRDTRREMTTDLRKYLVLGKDEVWAEEPLEEEGEGETRESAGEPPPGTTDYNQSESEATGRATLAKYIGADRAAGISYQAMYDAANSLGRTATDLSNIMTPAQINNWRNEWNAAWETSGTGRKGTEWGR